MALKAEAEMIAADIVRDGLGTPAGIPGLPDLDESAIPNVDEDAADITAPPPAEQPAPAPQPGQEPVRAGCTTRHLCSKSGRDAVVL